MTKNLCFVLTNEGRERIKEERKRRFGSQMIAALNTGIKQTNISRWERGENNPKLSTFRNYLQKLEISKEFFNNKKKYIAKTIYRFKINKVKSIRLSKELSYILGVVGPGDGYITKYSIGLDTIDKEFADYFQYCSEKVFGLKCKRYIRIKNKNGTYLVKKSSKQYAVMLHSKLAVESLKKYNVQFKEKNWRIPKIIKEGREVYKSEYLRGFFDSQSSVSVNGKFIAIRIFNKEGLKEIQNLLKDIKIESHIYENGTKLNIYGQKNFRVYWQKIWFIIVRKNERLKKILDNYKFLYPLAHEIAESLPKMIELRKQGLSYRKISSLIGIGRECIRKNLIKGVYT